MTRLFASQLFQDKTKANIRIGNGRDFLMKVISQSLPFIGYPRSLNAIRCVKEASGA